jgi:hypothetical protein
MNMLRNFTIRFVMLTILGIFCLMWAGVGCTVPGPFRVFRMAMTWIVNWSNR